jgi:hypothetical protein
MPVVQVALDFTDEILAGVASGKYTANGSVIRDLTGAIVTHVPEVKIPAPAVRIDLTRISATLKDPRVLAVIGIGVVATFGITAFVSGKKKREIWPDLPKSLQNYDSALSTYLIAIGSGNLDAAILSDLIAALSSFQHDIESGIITVESSTELSTNLLSVVRDFTKKFAEANGVEVGGDDGLTFDSDSDSISWLRYFLEVQQRVIEEAS